MKPAFHNPAAIMIAPVISDSIEASATALAGSPSAMASGRTVAAITGPSEESGPRTRIRDGPKIAYPIRHSTDVYSPVTGGRPASSA